MGPRLQFQPVPPPRSSPFPFLAALAVLSGALLLAIACQAGEAGFAAEPAIRADDDACGQCHAEELDAWRSSREHRSTGAGSPCLLCHATHETEGEERLGPAGVSTRCEECHRDVEAEFVLPFRHPLDGEMSCTSCHPPHGLAPRREPDHLRRETCLECHRELAGPFLFEHDGSRERLCLSCHEAHGSPNRRLLTFADSRTLCTACHANLEDLHIQNPGSIFQDCLLCHTEVHGSDWDRELFT